MLLTLPVFTPDEAREARLLLERAPWGEGKSTAGSQAAQAKNNEQLPPESEVSRMLQQKVLQALDRTPRFLAAALPRKVFPPRFNRYSGGLNAFGPHVDGAIRFTEGGVRIRSDLSCTIFLTEPSEYDGGELVMLGNDGGQSVKLAAGLAVLYPASSVHEVRPVTRGTRLACFFWIESMVRSHEQRRLLLELDDALTGLRSRHGDDADTVALAGTYHNLLRMWADT
jgi:PKHD-type hydroxylase